MQGIQKTESKTAYRIRVSNETKDIYNELSSYIKPIEITHYINANEDNVYTELSDEYTTFRYLEGTYQFINNKNEIFFITIYVSSFFGLVEIKLSFREHVKNGELQSIWGKITPIIHNIKNSKHSYNILKTIKLLNNCTDLVSKEMMVLGLAETLKVVKNKSKK